MKFVADERKCHTVYPPADQVFTWTQMCDIRDVSALDLKNQATHTTGQHYGQNKGIKISESANMT